MECDICMIEWDSKVRIPRLLSCGHTFCEKCLLSMLSKAQSNKTDFFCPNCMSKQKEITKEEDIKALIKNFNLLRIVEKIEARKSVLSHTSFMNDKDKSFKNIITEENHDVEGKRKNPIKANLEEDRYSVDSKCKKHGLPAHSYAIGTNLYFCDICVKETSLKTSPIPNVVKNLKRNIDSIQARVCLLKNEIERVQEFFDSYQDEFERSNKQKIDELFNYIHKIISYNYNTAMQILKQCKGEQKSQIDSTIKELLSLYTELEELEAEMNKLSELEDKDLVRYNEKIFKIQQKINYYLNYDLEINLLAMKIGIKDDLKDKLFFSIQDSYFVDVEFANIKGESPSLKHILQKEKYWPCLCGELNNPLNESFCFSCNSVRRVETMGNILAEPLNVSSADITFLNKRRKDEGKNFQELFKTPSGQNKYYVIDIEWFLNWKCFISNDNTEKSLANSKKKISPNKSIGVLPPGPISNYNLFDKNTKDYTAKNFKKGMKKNEDYLVINEATFKFFYLNYNGGPEIVISAQDDVYSNLLYISPKDFFFYASLKEADPNSVDESNISEMNYTDLSTKFSKNPNSSKVSSKLRTLNSPNQPNQNLRNKQTSAQNPNNNQNQNQHLNYNMKEGNELSQINEGNEVSLMSKDEDASAYESETIRRICSGESNSFKSEDESGILSKMNLNSRPNHALFNSNANTNYNNNLTGVGNYQANSNSNSNNNNVINLKLSSNYSNNVTNANSNQNQISGVSANNREEISRNRNNFGTQSSSNFNSMNPNENKNKINIGVGSKNIIHPMIRNANTNINLAINHNVGSSVNNNLSSNHRDKEIKK